MSSDQFLNMLRKVPTLIIAIIFILTIFGLGKQISGALQAGKRLDQAVETLSQLQEENRQLKKDLSMVNQYDFVEKIARDKLNLGKPNETVVIIPDSVISKVLGEEKKVEEVKLPNWQAWLKLIFH